MLTITHDTDGRVMRIGYADKALPKGAIEVGAIPHEPTLAEGKACELYWDGKALEWRIFDAPPPPEPEPIPEPEEPAPPTNEEISQMRQSAYEAECDSLLIAWMGYTAEGDTEKAESALKAYLKAKAEVRRRLPYAEGDMDKACKDCVYFRRSGERCTCTIDDCLIDENGTCREFEPRQ